MYLTTYSPFRPGFTPVGFGAPAAVAPACMDQAIDAQTALLFTDKAPLSGVPRKAGCDHKAVWAFVPTPRPDLETVHVYLHGNNNTVPVDARRPGGRPADWSPGHTPHALRKAGPYASGPKYGMDTSAQASSRKPIVLVPEDAQAPTHSSKFWAVGAAGGFQGNPALLGQLIDDCRARLVSIRGASGALLSRAASVKPLTRLFLSGHSGGGVPLSHACLSGTALNVPTDLWLYDCTYWPGHVARYVEFLRLWKDKGRLRNAPDSSRMVIVVGGSDQTQATAAEILRKASSVLGWRKTVLDRRGFTPALSPSAPSQLLEIRSGASTSLVESGLRRFPVVLVFAREGHDYIPLMWTPRLLATAS